MTIFNTSYDTTFGKSIIIAPIVHALEKYLIQASSFKDQVVLEPNLAYKGLEINGLVSEQSDIPVFYHPIAFPGPKNQKHVAVDLRAFIRSDTSSKITVVNKSEYGFVVSRYLMQFAWLNYNPEYFRTNFFFSSVIFSAWITELIAKRYALDPLDTLKIKILSHYYYATLFVPEDKLTETQLEKLTIHTIKSTRASNEYVQEVFGMVGVMRDVNDFCKEISNVVNNVRLKDFSAGVLITLAATSWFGYQSKEVLTIALEHPPTWIAICIAALEERTYKNSTIAKIAEKVAKTESSNEMLKNYKVLIDGIVINAKRELTFEDLENVVF